MPKRLHSLSQHHPLHATATAASMLPLPPCCHCCSHHAVAATASMSVATAATMLSLPPCCCRLHGPCCHCHHHRHAVATTASMLLPPPCCHCRCHRHAVATTASMLLPPPCCCHPHCHAVAASASMLLPPPCCHHLHAATASMLSLPPPPCCCRLHAVCYDSFHTRSRPRPCVCSTPDRSPTFHRERAPRRVASHDPLPSRTSTRRANASWYARPLEVRAGFFLPAL